MGLSGDQWICVIAMVCVTAIIITFVIAASIHNSYQQGEEDDG